MQWENLIPFLKRKNYDDIIDDSIYQDFSVIQVETNWYNYELNLHAVPEDNPFMKILRLVWDEYKTVFKEKIWCCLGSRYLGGLKLYGGAEW